MGDGAPYSIPLERMPRLPSDHRMEKKRREAGEIATRRAAANTGILFATGLSRARAMPDRKPLLKQ